MAGRYSRSLVMLVLLYATMAVAEQPDSIRLRFNYNDGEWVEPRCEFFSPGVDLETDQDKDGRLLAVRVDLNGDGEPEYLIRTLCGNGGCEYPIFEGRTYAYLGRVFGSEVWLLQRNSHQMAVIESYSHLAALRGTIGRYEFDGTRYREISTWEIGDEEIHLLYRRLGAAPRIKAQ